MPGNADKCPSVFPEAKDDVFKLFCPNSSELKQRQFLKFENRGKTGASQNHITEAAIREYLVILLEKKNLISSKISSKYVDEFSVNGIIVSSLAINQSFI